MSTNIVRNKTRQCISEVRNSVVKLFDARSCPRAPLPQIALQIQDTRPKTSILIRTSPAFARTCITSIPTTRQGDPHALCARYISTHPGSAIFIEPAARAVYTYTHPPTRWKSAQDRYIKREFACCDGCSGKESSSRVLAAITQGESQTTLGSGFAGRSVYVYVHFVTWPLSYFIPPEGTAGFTGYCQCKRKRDREGDGKTGSVIWLDAGAAASPRGDVSNRRRERGGGRNVTLGFTGPRPRLVAASSSSSFST